MADNNDQKSKSVSGWVTIVAAVISLITYIVKLICGKANNSDITKAERNKKNSKSFRQ